MADSIGLQSTRELVLSGNRRRLGDAMILCRAPLARNRRVDPDDLSRRTQETAAGMQFGFTHGGDDVAWPRLNWRLKYYLCVSSPYSLWWPFLAAVRPSQILASGDKATVELLRAGYGWVFRFKDATCPRNSKSVAERTTHR